jgi:outer membrane lipoprotein-sorting protein
MKNRLKLGATLGILFVFLLAGSSCSLFRPVPGMATSRHEARAAALISELKAARASIENSRGAGTLRWQKDGREMSARLIWVARRPDKLRVELLGPFGTSMGRLSSDGRQIYFSSPDRKGIHQSRFSDEAIARLIDLPVKIPEFVAVLTGGIPFRYNRHAWWDGTVKNGHIKLILWDRPFGGYQEMMVREDGMQVLRTEIFESRNQLAYGTQFKEGDDAGNALEIPKQWHFYGETNTTMSFVVDRSEVNVEINDDLFRLSR